VARLFNALDHVTEGRIAWNAVTSRSKNEAANWGYDKLIEHDARYEQAQEHLHVVRALWDSVEDGAVIFDRESGIFGDPQKVHVLNFRGRYYNVRGPLPSLRSPQGRPVIIQAGQSGPGLDLAATYADMQFSTRRTIPSMKEHRARLDAKLATFGRSPRDCGILWSVRIQVAESERQAQEKERQYLDSIPPEAGLIELSSMYGLDFSRVRQETRLADLADEVKAQNTHLGSFEEILKTTDPGLTVGEFGRKYMTERILVAAGTPKMIADRLEQLHFETGANGGFMLARGFSAPGNLREFVDLVVPELQRRGLAKKKYSGTTLRDNLLN
jgi:FMN-dependent oxidoreductase (nitrilotriacetate monooxygenase family)